MYAKKFRLSASADINQTLAKGRSFFSPFFTIKYLPKGELPNIAFVISKKTAKRAVVRNRTKRLVREALFPQLQYLHPGSYVVMIKPAALSQTFSELQRFWLDFLPRVKLLRHESNLYSPNSALPKNPIA